MLLVTRKIKELKPGDRVRLANGGGATVTAVEHVSIFETTNGQAFEVRYEDDNTETGGGIFSGGDAVRIEVGEHGKG